VICQTCKDQVHDLCRGGTWCDCQHRRTMNLEEYATALADLAEIRQQQQELRALDELTALAQEDKLGDYGPGL
jgi:hypothetical protein